MWCKVQGCGTFIEKRKEAKGWQGGGGTATSYEHWSVSLSFLAENRMREDRSDVTSG